MVYIVQYIKSRRIENPALVRAIRNFEGYAILDDGSFLLSTKWSASTIRERLKPYLREGDQLFVCRLEKSAAWTGFNEKFSQWVKNAFE